MAGGQDFYVRSNMMRDKDLKGSEYSIELK